MSIHPHQFWGSNHYQHPPLTDEMVSAAEAALGVTLPPELIALLKIQNGGYTQDFAYPMAQATSWAADHVPLPDLGGIVLDLGFPTAQNLLHSADMSEEWGLPEKQILLSGSGAYWLTLDYRKGPVPTVAWIDVDTDEDTQVAPSFAAFLAGLVPAATFDEA